jgi:hypothetical protein
MGNSDALNFVLKVKERAPYAYEEFLSTCKAFKTKRCARQRPLLLKSACMHALTDGEACACRISCEEAFQRFLTMFKDNYELLQSLDAFTPPWQVSSPAAVSGYLLLH